MISVVMATYNSEKYIIQQLESIIAQTKKVDEVVIQDDASKDDTINIINDFIEKNNLKNWKIEKNNENIGYIETFKNAIRRSNGDIIILCDHDDIWLTNKVEIIFDCFENNPNVLVLGTSFKKIDEEGNDIKVKKRRNYSNNNLIRRKVEEKSINKMTFKDIAIYNMSPGCTCAFSGKIKEKVLERKYNLPHDWQIVTIGAVMEGLYYLDVVTTKYRIYSNNTIGLGHEDKYSKRLKLCKNGLIEKKEIKKLMNSMPKFKEQDMEYIDRIIKVYELRKKLMETKNIIKYAPKIIFYCMGLNKIYESIGMDIISILKAK